MNLQEQIEREFLSVSLAPRNLLIYAPRTTILASVRRETPQFHGTVLDIGCGFMPYRKLIESNRNVTEYLGLDLASPTYYANVEPDLKWDGREIPLEDSSVDCVMATEFLEHYAEPDKILAEIFRVTRSSGRFFATVPFIWNLHEVPFDEYRYTPYSLRRLVQAAGFSDVEIRPLGGWNMAMAQQLGLWLTFAPMRNFLRSISKLLVFPIFALLVKTDRIYENFDGHGNSMFSGLSLTARK